MISGQPFCFSLRQPCRTPSDESDARSVRLRLIFITYNIETKARSIRMVISTAASCTAGRLCILGEGRYGR